MSYRTTLVLILGIGILGLPASGTAQPSSCVDQVPTLTGNTSAVSSSGIFGLSYEAWTAFDADVGGSSMWISEVFETPAWIAYDFGVGTVIDRYLIRNCNGQHLTSRAPKDFTFEGWDGTDWITIDTRTGETNWLSCQPRTYIVASPGSYSQYRLHITDDNDIRQGVVVISISDLQFLPCPAELFADGFESGDTSAWSGESLGGR